MSMYMRDITSRTTTFTLDEYSGEHNGYDRDKLHPANHKLVVVYKGGKELSLDVKQLSIFLEYSTKYRSMSAALDAVHSSSRKEEDMSYHIASTTRSQSIRNS